MYSEHSRTVGRCFYDALCAKPSQVSAPAARAASSAAEVTEKRFSAFPGRLTSTVLPEVVALRLGCSVTTVFFATLNIRAAYMRLSKAPEADASSSADIRRWIVAHMPP